MKSTQETKRAPTAHQTTSAESPTGIASGGNQAEAEKLASIAGNPTAEEAADWSKGHKMKKTKVPGSSMDYWICQKCGFGVESESAAKEHEAQPI